MLFLKAYWASSSRNDCSVYCHTSCGKTLREGRELSDFFTVISEIVFSTKFQTGKMQSDNQSFPHISKVMYWCNVSLRYLMHFSRSLPYVNTPVAFFPHRHVYVWGRDSGEAKLNKPTTEMCFSLHTNTTDASHVLLRYASVL